MQEILTKINRVPGVRGTMIAAADGFVIAADLAGGEDPSVLGALASGIISRSAGALTRLEQGELRRFVINGSDASLALLPVGEAILLTLLRKDANMGLVLVELKTAAVELAEKLGPSKNKSA